MLVGDLADDLLDDVLERDDARRAAVLVDDDGHLEAALAQLAQQRVEADRLGHDEAVGHERRDRHVLAPLVRHGHRLLDVDDAVDVVPVLAEHREARVPGAPRQPQHVVGRLVAVDAGAAHPRRHDVVGRALAEAERAGQHPCGRDVEGAGLGRALDEARELLRRARARQLLLRLDAQPRAGSALAEPLSTMMSGLAMTAKTRTGSATTFAVASGAEMPRNCGSSSPKTIEKIVASTSARALDTASTAPAQSPSGSSGPDDEAPDGGLREVADDEGRDRDADLGRRQLGRELLERLEHDAGPGVALVDGALDRGPVEGHERELGGDEERGAGGEQHGAEDEEPLGHRAANRPCAARCRDLVAKGGHGAPHYMERGRGPAAPDRSGPPPRGPGMPCG